MRNIDMKQTLKKGIPIALATTLVFSYGVGDTLANGKGKGNNKNGNAKVEQKTEVKGLADIDGFWGQMTVEKMNSLGIIQGYSDGTFQPNKPVTQQEAVVMIVRLLGLEKEAQAKANAGVKLSIKNQKSIATWAHGHIDVALEIGLIENNDKFQGNKAASRLYVTSLMIKGLGIDVTKYEGTDLQFSDLAQLSAEERLQLAVAVSNSLATGYGDKTFQPNKPVTRGEMAAFLERMMNQLDDKDLIYREHVKGYFTSFNATEQKVTMIREVASLTQLTSVTYSLADQIVIYYDGKKRSSFDLFKDGDRVEVILNKDGKVVYVQGTSKKEEKPVWENLTGVKSFDLELISGTNKILYKYDVNNANGISVLRTVNGQTTLLQGTDAAKAIKTMIETHFKADAQFDVKEVSKALAAQVQSSTQQEAKVSVNYKTTDRDLAFTVDVKQSTNSTTLNWAKDKATITYTEAKDATGKVVSNLELKDAEGNKDVSYRKEVNGTTVKASGHLKLNGLNLIINDTSFEPTITQLLSGYKVKLYGQTEVIDDQIIWDSLKGVSNFNLQMTSGQNIYTYSYNADKASDIYVLMQKNGQSSLLSGNEAAVLIKQMIDTHFKADVQFDVRNVSNTLATLVRSDAQQESKVVLNYKTGDHHLIFDVDVKSNTEATTLQWSKNKVTASYTQTKATNGNIVSRLDLKDEGSNTEVKYNKEVSGSTTTATGYIKLSGTNLTISDASLEPTVIQMAAEHKLKLSF